MASFNEDTMDGIVGALAGAAARFNMPGVDTTVFFGWEVAEALNKLSADMQLRNMEGRN